MALGAQALGGIAGGIADYQSAAAAKQQAQINAYIGKTRAIQTDGQARETLNRNLGSLRAGLASAGQGVNLGSAFLFDSYRKASSDQRSIDYGNAMSQSLTYKSQARTIHPGMAFLAGAGQAAPSLFGLYDSLKGK
jgi:hypothetical protein